MPSIGSHHNDHEKSTMSRLHAATSQRSKPVTSAVTRSGGSARSEAIADASGSIANTEAASCAYWRVNHGKQYTVNNFPTGEPQMFDKNAATYQVDDQAPEDNPPTYPPPAH